MYTITGEVINTFDVPASEKFAESYKVQLMGESLTNDGQIRKEMITLTVPLEVYSDLKSKIGKPVDIPVSLYARGGQIFPFYPKRLPAMNQRGGEREKSDRASA